MSCTIPAASIEPETVADIEFMRDHPKRGCGCHRRGEHWWLCDYHEGFDAGVEETKRLVGGGS